jgi:hypothetical protein
MSDVEKRSVVGPLVVVWRGRHDRWPRGVRRSCAFEERICAATERCDVDKRTRILRYLASRELLSEVTTETPVAPLEGRSDRGSQ